MRDARIAAFIVAHRTETMSDNDAFEWASFVIDNCENNGPWCETCSDYHESTDTHSMVNGE
jgi:hypothetical protein